MLLTQTDGRGNTTSTITDTAGRALVVTDAPRQAKAPEERRLTGILPPRSTVTAATGPRW